jgi:hypothetical protein
MREDDLGDEIGIVLAFLNELGEVRGNDAEGQRAVDQFLSVVFNKKWRRPWRGGAQDRRTEDFMGALVVVSQRLLLALSRKRGAVDRATEYRESRAVLSGLFPVLSSGGSPRTRRRRPSRGTPRDTLARSSSVRPK